MKKQKNDPFDILLNKVSKILVVLVSLWVCYIFLGEFVINAYTSFRVNRDVGYTKGFIKEHFIKDGGRVAFVRYIKIEYEVKHEKYTMEVCCNQYNNDKMNDNYVFDIKYCKRNPNLALVLIPDSLKPD